MDQERNEREEKHSGQTGRKMAAGEYTRERRNGVFEGRIAIQLSSVGCTRPASGRTVQEEVFEDVRVLIRYESGPTIFIDF